MPPVTPCDTEKSKSGYLMTPVHGSPLSGTSFSSFSPQMFSSFLPKVMLPRVLPASSGSSKTFVPLQKTSAFVAPSNQTRSAYTGVPAARFTTRGLRVSKCPIVYDAVPPVHSFAGTSLESGSTPAHSMVRVSWSRYCAPMSVPASHTRRQSETPSSNLKRSGLSDHDVVSLGRKTIIESVFTSNTLSPALAVNLK